MSEQRPWLRVTTLIAVVALVAAACGVQGTPAAGTPTTGPTATTPGETPEPFAGDSWEAGCANYPETTPGELDYVKAVDRYTVEFGLCYLDVAFLSKIAFTSFAILDKDYLDETKGTGTALEAPNGTGPYMVNAGDWVRGDHITFTKFDNFWDTANAAKEGTVIFRWNAEAAARLTELQSPEGVDGIDNPGATDFDVIRNDPSLQLFERQAINIFYVGMTNTFAPFGNEKVRQAIAQGIDRQRIVDKFYPPGSEVASHFSPCVLLGGCEGPAWYDFDATAAKTLLAEGLQEEVTAGNLTEATFPDTEIFYRDVVRGYLPTPPLVAADIQDQLATNLGITAKVTPMDSGAFITAANKGELNGFYLLGWGADYPDMTNFVDVHFGASNPQFGNPFFDLAGQMRLGGSLNDDGQRKLIYADVNRLIKEHVPMVPIAHGGSGAAYKAAVQGAYAAPLTDERFAVMSNGTGTIKWMQNAEPLSLFCGDESDGESLRACEQVYEPLYTYETGGTAPIPALAESCTASADNLKWTCTLRQGVTFHNGAAFDANDVVATYAALMDGNNPNHGGHDQTWYYQGAFFGSLLNPPPAPVE